VLRAAFTDTVEFTEDWIDGHADQAFAHSA
jgi:hypothetical protein